MINIFKKIKDQKGYAILFTVVIISAISVIVAGLTNVVYKQLILSSLAKDSQTAFYQADVASDCAMYADLVESKNGTFNDDKNGSSWKCGDQNLIITNSDYTWDEERIKGGSYRLLPEDENILTPCFKIEVTKDSTTKGTDMIANGYNICNKNNPRVVERQIEIKYDY